MSERINAETMMHVHQWTWANYMRLVEYEAMFHDTCVRDDLPEGTICHRLTRQRPGYSGFPTYVTELIFLHSPDGDVPVHDDRPEDERLPDASGALK